MFELEKTDEVNRLISITKSDSGISGPVLARAHMRLGELLGKQMDFDPFDTTVIAVMRGGIFFAEGIYFQLGCRFMLYDPKKERFKRPDTKHVILVDSVINTGKTIRDILTPDMTAACCVINKDAIPLLCGRLYAVRISENYFAGSEVKTQSGAIGPDTTMRLFNLI